MIEFIIVIKKVSKMGLFYIKIGTPVSRDSSVPCME